MTKYIEKSKKTLVGTLLLTILLSLSIFSSGKAAAENVAMEPNEQSMYYLESPQNYIEYLSKYSESDASILGVSKDTLKDSVSGSKEILKEFEELSYEDQILYLSYMKDPKLITKTLSASDPNLEFVSEENTNENVIMPLASTKSISHSGSLTALGIKWTTYHIDGRYEYNTKMATVHLSTLAYVGRSYNPTITTGLDSYQGYVSSGEYYGKGIFSYKIGVAGYGVQIGTAHLSLSGNHNGKIDGDFWFNH